MLTVLSPAKILDFGPAPRKVPETIPAFAPESTRLAAAARRLSRRKLRAMMAISPKLAELTFQRFQAFDDDPAPRGAKPAIFAFKGDTYLGLDAASLSAEDLAFAQVHLRILSGLYGVLRPFDVIQPYRLEMHIKMPSRGAKDLYSFWDDRIADRLNAAEDRVIVNLASAEYWKAAQAGRLNARVITPHFLEVKDGVARPHSLFLKRARGMMARYIIENRLDTPDTLPNFTAAGYRYMAKLSTPDCPVFHRVRP